MNKKISSLLMAAVMSATTATPAFASEVHITEAGGTGNSKITFEVVNSDSPEAPIIFSAYIPAVLPIKMDLDGNITVPTNAVIRNGVADRAIQVETATVVMTGDWQHTDMLAAASGSPDSHLLGLELSGQDLKAATFPWKIEAAGSLDLNMQAAIPQQTVVSVEEQIATIGFTLDWAKNKEKLNATNELDKAKMNTALKNLTGKLTFTTTAYTGEDGIDISKNGDGSVIAAVNGQDATVYSDGGVLGVDSSYGDYSSGMFYEYRVSNMDLHGLDTSKMTKMNYMFGWCDNLKTLDLSGMDMSSVTNAECMFYKCGYLASIDFSGADMSSTTDIKNMFYDCDILTNIDLSGVDMSNVTHADGMFSNNNILRTINFSNINMNNLVSTDGMFYNCYALTTVDFSKIDLSHVVSVSDMFYGCKSLSFLDLSGSSINKLANSSNMFYDCKSLSVCYASTQADCDKLNACSIKPGNVNFIVKPKN